MTGKWPSVQISPEPRLCSLRKGPNPRFKLSCPQLENGQGSSYPLPTPPHGFHLCDFAHFAPPLPFFACLTPTHFFISFSPLATLSSFRPFLTPTAPTLPAGRGPAAIVPRLLRDQAFFQGQDPFWFISVPPAPSTGPGTRAHQSALPISRLKA